MRSQRKCGRFINTSMSERSCTALPGIGLVTGSRMKKRGYNKVILMINLFCLICCDHRTGKYLCRKLQSKVKDEI